jgi:hypothetical protein
MNWGKATVLILIAFVLFIGSMSFYMFRSPKDDYDHQYYEDGINFDHDYNREAQVTKDHAEPVIKISSSFITVTFPQVVEGKVKLMRPSSDAADKSFKLEGEVITVPVAQLIKGKWTMTFDWKSGNKAYLYNTEVFIK